MDTNPNMADMIAPVVVARLRALADPVRAAAMKAYMRGQFEFLGIPTPLRRSSSAPLLRAPLDAATLLATARSLWNEEEREFQYLAADLLARQWKKLDPALIPELLRLARRKSWWDTVDTLAGVVGDLLRTAPPEAHSQMDAALRHPDKWTRRIAMLHQLGWRGDTDTGRLFGYALELAPEEDFFIRKAIGWALRDYARHDPAAVVAFLRGPGRGLSALSRREAAKHLEI